MRKILFRILFIELLAIVIILAFFGAYLLVVKNLLLVDEKDSWAQILLFTKEWALSPNIPSVRGYHILLTFLLRIFNNNSFVFLRTLGVFINLLSIPVIYLTARLIDAKTAKLTTLQFGFLPILSPFLSLTYNDVFSLTLVIFSVYLLLKGRYYLSGLVAILSMSIRQNNIIWLLFSLAFILLKTNGGWRKGVVHLFGIVLFIYFVIINRGVVVGDRQFHPLTISNLGNVYLMLFLIFFLFLPVFLNSLTRIVEFLKQNRIVVLAIFITYFIFMKTFSNPHPFNQSTYFLRNRILIFFTKSDIYMSFFFIFVVVSILTVFVNHYHFKIGPLIFIFSLISLVPLTLVEQRYYLIPLSLWLLFRKKVNPAVELTVLLLFIVYSLIIFKGIFIDNAYFL